MESHPHHAFPAQPLLNNQRYSATSSAFSASAQPHEDWTKISDLAERRRIQNRIAQRNYRKKLKKRLEDLERRAASHSASPEQVPAELDTVKRRRHSEQIPAKSSSMGAKNHHTSPSSHLLLPDPHFLPPIQDERSLFSQQYTRQVSTSPPPFSYSPYPNDIAAPFSYNLMAQPMTTTTTCHELPPIYPSGFITAPMTPCVMTSSAPDPINLYPPLIKQEMPSGQEGNPFNMTFASMAGLDATVADHTYLDASSDPQTPPLMDLFEDPLEGSPHSLECPTTPTSFSLTTELLMMDSFDECHD